MAVDKSVRVDVTGSFWFAGWLFTLAFAKLQLMQAIFAIIVWPYYLGLELALR